MKRFLSATFALLLTSTVFAPSSPSSTQQVVAPLIDEVPSGTLHRKGYVGKPAGFGPFPAVLFNHGSGAEDAQHAAGRPMAEAAAVLAPVFLQHGYVFFYFCRRGQGLSADQGLFTQELLKQAEAQGAEARKQLHYELITGGQLDDALAGVAFLKSAAGVDPKRIAIVGHSFGGMLTLLSDDHDATIRAEVTFGAGANSWRLSQELRLRVLASVDKTSAPIMLIHAANDYDTTAGTEPRSSSVSTNRACSRSIPPLARPPMMVTTWSISPCQSGNPTSSGFLTRMSNAEGFQLAFQRTDANPRLCSGQALGHQATWRTRDET